MLNQVRNSVLSVVSRPTSIQWLMAVLAFGLAICMPGGGGGGVV
jgi:hypothetical protein